MKILSNYIKESLRLELNDNPEPYCEKIFNLFTKEQFDNADKLDPVGVTEVFEDGYESYDEKSLPKTFIKKLKDLEYDKYIFYDMSEEDDSFGDIFTDVIGDIEDIKPFIDGNYRIWIEEYEPSVILIIGGAYQMEGYRLFIASNSINNEI